MPLIRPKISQLVQALHQGQRLPHTRYQQLM